VSPRHTPETFEADDHAKCRALGAVLDRIADKWTIMVVRALAAGPVRFNEMKRQIGGVSQRMLTLTLRNMERDGLVTRTIFPTVPPRVDYELTPLGHKLNKPLGELATWAETHLPEMEKARRVYDERKEPDQSA
jgi:DNA-binding HxlR family transcriptional regulator